ncbi:hypothetical protein ACFRCI_03610 [Streptomyces sp. NPDC056638]|uniref:hypothetical protein n=1 Tax=Streptomyces sp. NPDC056638 TaxID=3345887 RepID=UPI003690AAC9
MTNLPNPTHTNWVLAAPCAGVAGFVLPAGSRSTDKALIRKAGTHMALCRRCPFRVECIDHVMPEQSRFDGICGGRLWINGTAIRRVATARKAELNEPKLRATCGTDTAWLQHMRNDETPCLSCRSGKRLIDQGKKHRPAQADAA